tara:strand:- start:2509 stop:3609 length:1101 start_codon:yes stop_codon:yes gene_type:complete
MFLCAGAYYFLSAQMIINKTFVAPEVRQMVGVMTCSDTVFCVVNGWVRDNRSSARGKGKGNKSTHKPLTGRPKLALYLLPVFDLFGLVIAFEAIRVAGSGFHQTVGGASIPIGTVLNVILLRTKFSNEQLCAIGVVMAGLAVKCQSLMQSSEPFPVDAFALVIASCFGYAMRGITMEYLTTCKSPPTGDRMTLQMSGCGFFAWLAYFLVAVVGQGKVDAFVVNPFRAAVASYGTLNTFLLYMTHAVSRGLTSKGVMGIVKAGGSTALSLAQVTRASVIVVMSSLLFCGSDSRQCLDLNGVISAALVVVGGAAFAVAKSRAKLGNVKKKKTSAAVKKTPKNTGKSTGSSRSTATSTTVTRRRSARNS